MGRKQQAKRAAQSHSTQPPRQPLQGIERLVRLPRLARILLIMIPALAAAVLATPLVDAVYLEFFYSEATIGVPAYVIMAIALVVYIVGWVLFVGLAGEDVKIRPALYWYLLFAGIMILSGSLYFGGLLLSNLSGS